VAGKRPSEVNRDSAAPVAPPGNGHRRWPGRGRVARGVYDRGLQRRDEQWSLLGRAASWLLARPEVLLAALGSPAPAEADGRVLSRGVQVLIQLLGRIPGADASAWGPGADVGLARQRMRQSAKVLMPLRTDVYSSGRSIPGPEGAPPIPIRVYRRFGAFPMPPRPLPPAIVYFHGGGWVVGDVETYERQCRMLAAVTRCTVVSVDYRLAPEHPFPAAVDDSLAAYQWVHRHADELGVATGQVAVMGDSAGGNLAAVVSLLTRAGGRGAAADVPPPLVQGLVYPAVDARMGTDSHRNLGVGYILTTDGMGWFRDCYLPDKADWTSPEVSPLLADDHRGLPPALVVTAGFDPLRDEGADYAATLRAAGVPVTYRCYDDQVHGFVSMGIVPDSLALAVEVFDTMGRMVRAAADAMAA
jgi:acetyl esterase/lipase